MKKRTNREILEKLIKERKPERANYTFRLQVDLMEKLQSMCDANGIKPTAAIEELIKGFVEGA